jgi:tol-pal system protein YbgF
VLGQEPPRTLPRQAPVGRSVELPAGRRARALLPAVVLFLSGCAGVAEVTGTATQDDVFQLRADLTTAQQTVHRTRADMDALAQQMDRRLKSQSADTDRRNAALVERLDALAASLTALTARVEELTARLETLSRQARTSAPPPASTARPATPIPAPPGPPPAGPTPPGVSPTPAPGTAWPAPARPTTGALQPRDIYQAAYLDFSKGSYSLAIAGFREFVRRYPDQPLAGNAQYWIGEAYLSLARGYTNQGQADRATEALEQAVQEFNRVLANYPRGEKAPAALYKEALALLDLDRPALAQQRLQYLVENFPQAEETPLARERLGALKTR